VLRTLPEQPVEAELQKGPEEEYLWPNAMKDQKC